MEKMSYSSNEKVKKGMLFACTAHEDVQSAVFMVK